MKKWRVKEFSKITGVSVRTLHYYDDIGLLIPSERQPSGVRLYGKKNLHHILQILSLKLLKFDLSTIKSLMDKVIPVREEFIAQKARLEKEISKLVKAKKIIENIEIVAETAPLELVLDLVQVYRTVHHLEKMRARKSLPPHLIEKAAEYKEHISDILEQINTLKSDNLSVLCANFLEKVYSEFPDMMDHKENDNGVA
jgi:DNA-binding transcriptional MerR regulator